MKEKIHKLFSNVWTIPNVLTMLRLVAVPFFIWAYLAGARWVALGLFCAASLTDCLDGYLARHPEAGIDYIHGEDALRALVAPGAGTLAFMPRAFGKSELFPYIRRWGVLPRKTFSMGEAAEKRYYLEARLLEK